MTETDEAAKQLVEVVTKLIAALQGGSFTIHVVHHQANPWQTPGSQMPPAQSPPWTVGNK